jgi:hypothetical protein
MLSSSLPLAIRKAEKDRFGEVFTPTQLINAMLDKLPPSVWTDPAKKWLDPAAGFGNFFMEVYPRLMKSLEHIISEPAQRRRHILTQMLYMVEVNGESCARIRENPMFVGDDDEGNRVEVNLFCGSFLDQAIGTTAFTVEIAQFDVIVGNPPFNGDQTHEGKKGGGTILWPKFVEKSLRSGGGGGGGGDLLKRDGFLLFVHPALWRKPPSERSSASVSTLFNKMTHDNHMLYLEIHNKLDGKRDFGVQTRYDYYVIQKRLPTRSVGYLTRIKDQTGRIHDSVDLSAWHFFLPNHSFEIIKPLLLSSPPLSVSVSVSDVGIDNSIVIFSRCQYGSDQPWVSDTQDAQHIYPVVHSTPKAGPRMMWSSKVNTSTAMFGVPKVIFGESGVHDVIVDIEGKYGMTQGAIGLKIIAASTATLEAEAQQMKSVLESREFHTILDAMSFSNFRIDWRMFLYFCPNFYKKIHK